MDNNENSALWYACYYRNEMVAMSLLKHMDNAIINHVDSLGNTILDIAYENNMTGVVCKLILCLPKKTNIIDTFDNTLHYFKIPIELRTNINNYYVQKMTSDNIIDIYNYKSLVKNGPIVYWKFPKINLMKLLIDDSVDEILLIHIIAKLKSKKIFNQIDSEGDTLLIVACLRKFQYVALQIISKMNHRLIRHTNKYEKSALLIAYEKNLYIVIDMIKKINKKID